MSDFEYSLRYDRKNTRTCIRQNGIEKERLGWYVSRRGNKRNQIMVRAENKKGQELKPVSQLLYTYRPNNME